MNQLVFPCCFGEEARDWKDQKSLFTLWNLKIPQHIPLQSEKLKQLLSHFILSHDSCGENSLNQPSSFYDNIRNYCGNRWDFQCFVPSEEGGKQLHLKHMIPVERADQTIPRSSCVACRPLADGCLCCTSHTLVQLGSYFLLQILVLYCAGGHRLGKGCRLTSWLRNSDFYFLLCWLPPFSLLCLWLPCASLTGESLSLQNSIVSKVRELSVGRCGRQPLPWALTASVHTCGSSRWCGAGIVGLGRTDLGLDAGCQVERPWLISHTLLPEAFLLFLTFLPFGIVHFPFWL